MTTEQVIRANGGNTPVGQSIKPVSESLVGRLVFVATDETAARTPGRLRFKTANDSQGRTWAYAYTSEAEFSRAFPAGGGFAELAFVDFFNVIERDAQFAGVFLNAGSDASYLIPREVFEHVKRVLATPAGQ